MIYVFVLSISILLIINTIISFTIFVRVPSINSIYIAEIFIYCRFWDSVINKDKSHR